MALGAAALVTWGCQQGLAINEPTTPDLNSVTDFFDEVVDVNGSFLVTFDITKTEYAQVTLIGISTPDPLRPLDVQMGMRVGQASAAGCTELMVTNAAPSFQAQLGRVLERGTYCLEVFDIGNITEPVSVLARVVHPAPFVQPRPATVTASSNITVGGRASRSFDATAPGTATITLTDLQPNVTTGLGLGMQQTSGTGCRLTRAIATTARSTAHFTVPVDPGTYCAQVYDIGNYTETARYTLRISHP